MSGKADYGFTQGEVHDIYVEEAKKAPGQKPDADAIFNALCRRNVSLSSHNKMVLFYFARSVHDKLRHCLKQGKPDDYEQQYAATAIFPADRSKYASTGASSGRPRGPRPQVRAPPQRSAVSVPAPVPSSNLQVLPRLVFPAPVVPGPSHLAKPEGQRFRSSLLKSGLRSSNPVRPPAPSPTPEEFGTPSPTPPSAGASAATPPNPSNSSNGGREGRDQRQAAQKPVNYFAPTRAPVGLHDERGILVKCGLDLCDCLDPSCPGCFNSCSKCGGGKCGLECRNGRKWQHTLKVEDEEYTLEGENTPRSREFWFNPEIGSFEQTFDKTDVFRRGEYLE